MADATDHALQAAVKALAEVVSPAVDPADPLAVDQLRLAIGWLQFHGQRRHDERRLAWAKLRQRLAQARDVRLALKPATLPPLAAVYAALGERCDAAEALLARADASTGAWRDAADGLDETVCRAIELCAAEPGPMRDALADRLLAHARHGLLLQRAWFAPLGFEARPDAVPPLAELLDGAPRD